MSDVSFPEMLKRLEELKRQELMRESLPHLFRPHYRWSHEIFHSTNKEVLFTAANQVGKSVVMQRKNIHWATEPSLWPKLWKTKPTQFWYFYPSWELVNSEFDEKWVKESLPSGLMEKDPKYGWKHFKDQRGNIAGVKFNSGVTIRFKTYEQKSTNQQAGTVYLITGDEEIPITHWNEMNFRRMGCDGYFMSGFTATLSQEFWRQAMEVKGKHERFKTAFKKQISLYDCMEFVDGSPSDWTLERIQKAIDSCTTEAEVQRRIYGRFVKDKNRRYEGFSREVNLKPGHPIPSDWRIYAGVDIGSGGGSGHPPAITFVGVSPDYTKGRVFRIWKGIDRVYTAGDIVDKYEQLKAEMGRSIAGQVYDYSAVDFGTIASQRSMYFQRANKDRSAGDGLLNTLFKVGALQIYEGEFAEDLCIEIENAPVHQAAKKNDDVVDSLRYTALAIPWDFTKIIPIKQSKIVQVEDEYKGLSEREASYLRNKKQIQAVIGDEDDIDSTFMELNELYGS